MRTPFVRRAAEDDATGENHKPNKNGEASHVTRFLNQAGNNKFEQETRKTRLVGVVWCAFACVPQRALCESVFEIRQCKNSQPVLD
jgi:siroheme synthase (precorrin-2 oxidase/ferrochelatase)